MWRVIVVDDEPIMRELLCAYIEWVDLDLQVIETCEDGAQALPRILALRPDIVMTNISMPRLGGIELFERLRAQEVECEVILVSASSEFVHVQRAVQLGAFDYLLKPVSAEMLRNCLGSCVKKLRAARSGARPETLPVSESYCTYTRHALQYIHAHYQESIHLGSAAEHVNVSKSHLSKVFKKDIGCAFNEYLIAYRMNAAHALLREGTYKVYEVASRVGYSDIVHFSKMFKKTFGISPKNCALFRAPIR